MGLKRQVTIQHFVGCLLMTKTENSFCQFPLAHCSCNPSFLLSYNFTVRNNTKKCECIVLLFFKYNQTLLVITCLLLAAVKEKV